MKWYDNVGLYAIHFILGALLMGVCNLLFGKGWEQWIAFMVGIVILLPFIIWNAYATAKYFRLRK